jgi:hypothetical protein
MSQARDFENRILNDDTKKHTIDNGDKDPTLSCLLSPLISSHSPNSTVITTMNATTAEKSKGDNENTHVSTKAVFFDLGGSSMGARIHLWLAYRPEIASQYIETRIITSKDLQTPEYGAINPMRKAPALIRQDGATVFESAGEYCVDERTLCVLQILSGSTLSSQSQV